MHEDLSFGFLHTNATKAKVKKNIGACMEENKTWTYRVEATVALGEDKEI